MKKYYLYLPLLACAIVGFSSCKKNDKAEAPAEPASAAAAAAKSPVSQADIDKAKNSTEDETLALQFYYKADHAANVIRNITPQNLATQKEELQKECDVLQAIADRFAQSFKVLVVSSGEAQEELGRKGSDTYTGLDAVLAEFAEKRKAAPGVYDEIQPLVDRLISIVNEFAQ